jgi:hypothetical protein
MRVYQMTTRTKLGAIALGVLVLVVGGTLLAFGVVLLVGLAVVGLVFGGLSMLWGKLTGRGPFGFLRRGRRERLDPSREVFAVDPSREVFAVDPSREVFAVDDPAGAIGPYASGRERSLDEPAEGQIR